MDYPDYLLDVYLWEPTFEDESEDEVHPMYCQWCGAEYGEDWTQCECWDNTGLEVES